MAAKPNIANPQIEYDVRVLTLNDGDTVLTWPDSSGQGNDATRSGLTTPEFVDDGWTLGISAVRLTDGENFEFLEPQGTVFTNTEFTFFVVFQATDLLDGLALVGSKVEETPPRGINIAVDIDGTIFFNKNFIPRNVESAPGTIVAGTRYIVSARKVDATGMILRVNGVEVGSNGDAESRTSIIGYTQPRIGQTRNIVAPGGEYGLDKLIGWVGGYSSAASDAEILAMEAFLAEVFSINLGVPPTEWIPSNVPASTTWVPTVF